MKHVVSLLLFIFLLSGRTSAQIIATDIDKDLQYPVVFSDTIKGQTLFLFYSDEQTPRRPFKFQLALTDTLGAVIRQDPVKEVALLKEGGRRLRFLGAYADAQYCYAFFRSKDIAYRLRIAPQSGDITASTCATFEQDETILGGFSERSKIFVVTREKDLDRGYLLNIYSSEGEKLVKHAIRGRVPRFFNKEEYKPLPIVNGEDLSPSEGANPHKIFQDGNKFYFTSEETPNVFSDDVLKLDLMVAELDKDTLYTRYVDFPNKGKRVAGASGASCIFDGNLFQWYYDHDKLGLAVRSLPDLNVKFEQFLTGEDSLSALLNSPVNASGVLGKVRSASRLTRVLQPTLPYIYVKKTQGILLVGLGGYALTQYAGGPGPSGMVTSYASERSISFYTAMNPDAKSRASRTYEATIIKRLDDAKAPGDGRFMQINSRSKYLYYRKTGIEEIKTLFVIDIPGY